MKKGLLAVLLAVAMVAPVFAAKGDMSVNAKLGLGFSNTGKLFMEPDGGEQTDDVYMGIKFDTPISFGGEFFYGLMDNLSVGFGVNYTLDSSETFEGMKVKAGTTNLYLAVKPEFKVETEFISSVYLIGQIGLAMPRMDIDRAPVDISVDSGLYLGAGFGAMIKDAFFVELILSSSNGTAKFPISSSTKVDIDVQYTATTLNVGYKFAL